MKRNTNKIVRANKGQAVRDLTRGRVCSSCKIYKERDCFFEHPTGFNGLQARCKDCCRIYNSTPKALAVKKSLYDKRRLENLCVGCGSTDLVSNVHCRECWFLDRASARAGGAKNLLPVLQLWEDQNGKCYYSGETLIPGNNASLDHQVPSSRGGLDDPSNLRWVSSNINMMKSNMSHDEFISMCEKIYLKFKAKENERLPKK